MKKNIIAAIATACTFTASTAEFAHANQTYESYVIAQNAPAKTDYYRTPGKNTGDQSVGESRTPKGGQYNAYTNSGDSDSRRAPVYDGQKPPAYQTVPPGVDDRSSSGGDSLARPAN